MFEIPTIAHTEECYRLYRIDIVGKQNGEVILRDVRVEAEEVLDWQQHLPSGVQIDAPVLWE